MASHAERCFPKCLGPELMRAFTEFKCIWDPGNKMNPHKVVNPTCRRKIAAGCGLQAIAAEDPFAFAETTALCRKPPCDVSGWEPGKQDGGAMCPAIWLPSKRTQHQGRAHLLFEMLQGEVIREGWQTST